MATKTVSPALEQQERVPGFLPSSTEGLTFQIVRNLGNYAALTTEIRRLREATGQAADVTTDPAWFIAKTIAEKRRPWLVMVRQSGTLVAVLQLAEKCFFSIPTGYLRGGDAFGQGFLIAAPGAPLLYPRGLQPVPRHSRETLLRAGLKAIFDHGHARFALLSLDAAVHHVSPELQPAGVQLAHKQRPAQYRLRLQPTVDATLKLFGSHTRRNLRYYHRKALDDGWAFHPALDRETGTAAVLELIACSTHPITVEEALRRLELMHATAGSFAMGLRTTGPGKGSGDWLSYLAGWRQGNRSYVFFQMNDANRARASVSTVMRSYLIQQEVERGTREIVFLDGTSPMMARGCLEDSCVDVFLYRKGLRSFLINRVFAGLLEPGHPLRMM